MMAISAKQKELVLEEIGSCRYLVKETPVTNTIDSVIQCENLLALDELEACLNDHNLEEIPEYLVSVFAKRWERIRRSVLCYTQKPMNLVNRLFVDLANVLSPLPKTEDEIDDLPFGTGPYFLLMPTLKAHQDVFGQNIHQLQLHEFILSDNEELFIPLHKCLNNAFVSHDGQFIHVVSKDHVYPRLTPNELHRIKSHSLLINEYYEEIVTFNKFRFVSKDFGAQLTRLNKALRAGGASRAGEELNAGMIANEGIVQFSQYWETVPNKQKALLYSSFPRLEEILGRLMRPDDENYKQLKFCVELIAHDIDPIIAEYTRAQTILSQVQQNVIKKQKAFLSSAKNPDYPVIFNAELGTPRIIGHIFSLNEAQRNQIFKFEPQNNALLYALEHAPFALPEYFHLLDEDSKQQAINAEFGPKKSSALIIAAYHGAEEAVNLLLNTGAPVNAVNNEGLTALQAACYYGHVTVIKRLLASNAEVDAETFKNVRPIHFAVRSGHTEIMQLLFQHGANITSRTQSGKNILDVAKIVQPQLIEPILLRAITLPLQEQKEFLSKVSNGIHASILLYAAASYPYLLNDLLNILQEEQHAEVRKETLEAQNNRKETVLMLAASAGLDRAVNQLLDMGADLNARNRNNSCALHKAVLNSNLSTIKLLLKKGAGIDTKGYLGITSLQYTVVRRQIDVMNYLLNKGADIKSRKENGTNVFDHARIFQPDLIQRFLLTALMTLTFDEQKEFLSRVEGGIYENILLYTAVEQPDFLPEAFNLLDIRHEDFANANEEMLDFFDFDKHIQPFHDRLQELEKKALDDKHYRKAAKALQIFINRLTLAKMTFIFSSHNTSESKTQFIKQCKETIALARPSLKTHHVFHSDSFIQGMFGFFSTKYKMPHPLTSFEAEIEHLAARNLQEQAAGTPSQ
ncbi:ankyrin repeat domain-containing protein [Legionella quateirensis]|uniref:Ankyrin repeat protein n=1 Tax=Legionella quateirensis TaxID=45072 RepID=A0A378KZE4_9GAMM|nr:ankyrin repeat domain-containing protein [Legionella quateirensis]KTD46250.1 ankyrin repeat protein [Legionella quateirensis]STY18981.1 ankyrin repeat protein [Legionella quateirensis]